MSLIFEALQKLDRRRAGLDLHPKVEVAGSSEREERKTTPRWETDPLDSNGEVPLSEYAEQPRFSNPDYEVPPVASPAVEEPSNSVLHLAEPMDADPAPVDQVPADNAPAIPVPTVDPQAGPALEPSAPAPAEPAHSAEARSAAATPILTVSEIPIQVSAPDTRVVPVSHPPQPAAPRASAPPPARAAERSPARPRPAGDVVPFVELLAGLKTQQRELRELSTERKASLLRLGDHLDGVRLSSDRNTLQQSELFKDLRGIGKKINFLAIAGLVLTAASVGLSIALYLRFLNVIH